MNNTGDREALRAHVADLEAQLRSARRSLVRIEEEDGPQPQSSHDGSSEGVTSSPNTDITSSLSTPVIFSLDSSIHPLLLLSDSALPLGSFAYSSGLESFLAHHKPLPRDTTLVALFRKFLRLSIQSVAVLNVPYVLAAFRCPLSLQRLDNDLDASTICPVARRASVAQGRALLNVWEKSLSAAASSGSSIQFPYSSSAAAAGALKTFAANLRADQLSPQPSGIGVNGHLAPLWGVVCLAAGLNLEETGYLFLFNHAKAVLSAAVRSSVIGPYSSQQILASQDLQRSIRTCLAEVWNTEIEDAGQVVPIMDLWIGRHELLYSRIFNS